MINKFLQLLSW